MSLIQSTPLVLRVRHVCQLLNISRSSLYEKISPSSPRYDPTFPRPFKLGAAPSSKAIGFWAEAIASWVQARIEASKR